MELTRCTHRVALLIQIHLAQNRLDLAQQEVRKAKSWAQDALLVNIAEAWVGLREVCLYCAKHFTSDLTARMSSSSHTNTFYRVVISTNQHSTPTKNLRQHLLPTPQPRIRARFSDSSSRRYILDVCLKRKLHYSKQ